MEVKNRFDIGDEIEFFSPTGTKLQKVTDIYKIMCSNHSVWKEVKTQEMFDSTQCEREETAHGGGFEVWINCEYNPWEFTLIRKKIT